MLHPFSAQFSGPGGPATSGVCLGCVPRGVRSRDLRLAGYLWREDSIFMWKYPKKNRTCEWNHEDDRIKVFQNWGNCSGDFNLTTTRTYFPYMRSGKYISFLHSYDSGLSRIPGSPNLSMVEGRSKVWVSPQTLACLPNASEEGLASYSSRDLCQRLSFAAVDRCNLRKTNKQPSINHYLAKSRCSL